MKNFQYSKYNTISEWLLYINRHDFSYVINSLDRVILIAKKLNILKMSTFIITISGTNGKGSTCNLLEQIFLDAGYHVGLYTSPHLLNFSERVKINGQSINDSMIFTTVFEKVESVRGDIMLTFFEFITLSALLIFKLFDLDVIILEVGIGGRLDATNILEPNIAAITNIDLEHTSLLGNTRNMIGLEKSGIFRPNIPVFIGDRNIPYSIYSVSCSLKVLLYRLLYEWYWNENVDFWNFYDQKGCLINLPIPKIALSNAALAISIVRYVDFNINIKNITNALKKIFLPGRFHIIDRKPYIILDVAHNPHAAKHLYKQLKFFLKNNNHAIVYGIIGMTISKDIKNFVSVLSNIIDIWCYVPLQTSRSVSKDIFKQFLPKNTMYFINISNALYSLLKIVHTKDIILVFGSFFAVSEAMIFMKNK